MDWTAEVRRSLLLLLLGDLPLRVCVGRLIVEVELTFSVGEMYIGKDREYECVFVFSLSLVIINSDDVDKEMKQNM